jgi:phosphoribosyl 1,2-cyclic phosphate phosphodiesterase
MAELVATILGCGSSGGVPRLGGIWGDCDPSNPRNRRRRCSLLLERHDRGATTRVLIDTSPDMRAQLLDSGTGVLDGVVYTHAHADHVHGIDDLRMIVFNRESRLPVWADPDTAQSLMSRFAYAFVQPDGSLYAPILDLHAINAPFQVDGPAGPIPFRPFPVRHGQADALGFRIHDLAYVPDISAMTDEAWAAVEGLDCWILDALRYRPHPTHTHLEQSLAWIARAAPRRAVLTNMHIDLDHDRVDRETPDNVTPGHDMMRLCFAV